MDMEIAQQPRTKRNRQGEQQEEQEQQRNIKRFRQQQQKMMLARQEDECGICLQPHPDYRMKRCPHVFHRKCIADWIFNKEDCPLCREPIAQQQARQLQKQWDAEKIRKKSFRRLMKCLKDEEPDVEEARRLLSDPDIRWSHEDLNTSDNNGFLPVTYAILYGDADLVRRFYEAGTNILSRNEDGVHPYEAIEQNLDRLRELRQKHQRTEQQTALFQNLAAAEKELLAMREYVGGRWLPIRRYLRRQPRPAVVVNRPDRQQTKTALEGRGGKT